MPIPLITSTPAAFATQAKVINAIAKALNSAIGSGGLKVTVSENKIILELATDLSIRNLDVSGILSVQGTGAFNSNVAIAGALDVGTNLDVGGITAIQGTLSVFDNVFFDQSLEVSGNLDIDGILAVQNNAAFYSNVAMSAGLSVGTSITIGGSALTRQTIQVCDGGVTKSMYVLGSATF